MAVRTGPGPPSSILGIHRVQAKATCKLGAALHPRLRFARPDCPCAVPSGHRSDSLPGMSRATRGLRLGSLISIEVTSSPSRMAAPNFQRTLQRGNFGPQILFIILHRPLSASRARPPVWRDQTSNRKALLGPLCRRRSLVQPTFLGIRSQKASFRLAAGCSSLKLAERYFETVSRGDCLVCSELCALEGETIHVQWTDMRISSHLLVERFSLH